LSRGVFRPTVSDLRTAALIAATLVGMLALAGCEAESTDPVDEADAGTAETTTGGRPGATTPPKPHARTVRVDHVIDGDTLDLRNGKRIRLVQIDAPESSGECYGDDAGDVLGRILPPGTRITLERDPALDDVDRYGRLLRYVHKGRTNVSLLLVRRGAASVWFFDGDRGRYAERLLAAARSARDAGRGAWGACSARLDPTQAFETGEQGPTPTVRGFLGGGGGHCMAGYRPCLPVVGDLDCDDVEALGKAPVRVRGTDPYALDGDDDGVGCE
jgi:micrococcal nuclease